MGDEDRQGGLPFTDCVGVPEDAGVGRVTGLSGLAAREAAPDVSGVTFYPSCIDQAVLDDLPNGPTGAYGANPPSNAERMLDALEEFAARGDVPRDFLRETIAAVRGELRPPRWETTTTYGDWERDVGDVGGEQEPPSPVADGWEPFASYEQHHDGDSRIVTRWRRRVGR